MKFNRYSKFNSYGDVVTIPFIEIPLSDNDRFITYKKGESRLDKISYDVYGDPDYGWLILQANPECGSIEFEIEDNTVLRIPFPLINTLAAYNKAVEEYNNNRH